MTDRVLRGFSGEVAEYYARYRRGYPPAVVDALVAAFGLDADATAIDIGCGTGQLTLPIAERVRAVVGMDPESDMLRLAAASALSRDVRNISWMIGFDSDLPALAALLGPGSVAAVTVATAIQWMDHATLFAAARPLLRDGGGIAVVTNGTPLWLQDTDWSRSVRAVLEDWVGTEVGSACGTDEEARSAYRTGLAAAGYTTDEVRVEYDAELDLDSLVGGLLSAMRREDVADPDRRRDFAGRVRRALAPRTRFEEHVSVIVQTGTIDG